MKRADYGRLVWGAGVELAFALVIFLLLLFWTENATRSAFIRETASDWLTVTGQVLFPAAIAIWITYVNIESTDFGDYLRFQGAAGALHLSFVYPGFVFFATTLALIFCKGTKLNWISDAATFLLSYSAAVFLTMVVNVTALMRIYGAFRSEFEKERHRASAQPQARVDDS